MRHRPLSPAGSSGELPAPDADAQEHSARLAAAIRAAIAAAGGQITFARFMELALYAPGLGYYSAGARKFGAAGDFITAPELSPLFSRCLARQAAQLLGERGGDVLEVGAGSGAMAVEVLRELERLGQLPARYLILERSAELRERQAATLQRELQTLAARVSWLDDLPPPGFSGVVLANELLDALPAHRFVITEQGPQEYYIAWEDGFAWRTGPLSDARLAARLATIENELGAPLPPGYESEINLAADDWIRSVAGRLGAGLVLLVDYGYSRRDYYFPERRGGTLMCHYRHRAHGDPLRLVGLQDITAHVDFTAVAEAAHEAGLRVAGYTTQAYFLLGAGIAELASEPDVDARRQIELASQVRQLTLPGEMGERFKVLALTRGVDVPLQGFSLNDMRGRL